MEILSKDNLVGAMGQSPISGYCLKIPIFKGASSELSGTGDSQRDSRERNRNLNFL